MQRILVRLVPFALIALGIAALVYGIARGEMTFIYNVGTTICFHCIGIG